MHCHSTGFPRAYANIDLKNDVGSPPYAYNGGCMVRLGSAGIGVLNKGFIDLQQIPEDAVQILLHLEVEAGAAPEDYIDLVLKIYNSE